MEWNVAQAKQRFSEVLRAAVKEPQRIYNRRRLVAAIVDGETFEEFHRWKEARERKSIGDEFAELRAICGEEGGWELPTPTRQDRPNPFAERLKDASLRHERSQ
jgi:hypothetical protein